MRKITSIFLFSFNLLFFFAQGSITNEGEEFWFAFTKNRDLVNAVYQVNISGTKACTGYVEIPGTGFYQAITITPGVVTKVVLPPNDAVISTSEQITQQAIHVVTTEPVVVYSNTYYSNRSEASLVLPVQSVGDEYRSMCYFTQPHNTLGFYQSAFLVVNNGNTVTVEITPTANTQNGKPANVPFQVTLNPGEVYQVLSEDVTGSDLSGSLIKSVTPGENFALYSGHVWAWVTGDINTCVGGTKDPIYEVSYPISSWGTEYFAFPTLTRTDDLIRVIASEDNTQISIDGTLVSTLNAGQLYETNYQQPIYIEGNKPISVGAFILTANCSGGGLSDPSMIVLNPNEQMYLDTITFFTITEDDIQNNMIHVVTRISDIDKMFLDGSQISPSSFISLPQNPEYAYYSVDNVTPGNHQLTTKGCGFIAYVVGIGSAESYAYAAGVSLIDLESKVEYVNVSASRNSICLTDTVQFSNQVSGTFTDVEWDFGDGTTSTLESPKKKYAQPGEYEITFIASSACIEDTVIDTLVVYQVPSPNLGADVFECHPDSSIFLTLPDEGYDVLWLNDNTTDTSFIAQTDGQYIVEVSNEGCIGRDTINLTFETRSQLTIELSSNQYCDDDSVLWSYTDTKSADNYSYFINGQNVSGLDTIIHQPGNYTLAMVAEYTCYSDTISTVFEILETPFYHLNDTMICDQSDLVIETNLSYPHLWSTNETQSSITIQSEGDYWLELSNQHCINRDSFNVSFFDNSAIETLLVSEDSICENQQVEISFNTSQNVQNFELYLNNNLLGSDVNNVYTVSGIRGFNLIRVEVDYQCVQNTIQDTFNVSKLPPLQLTENIDLCNEDTYTFTLDSTYEYIWSNGDRFYTTVYDESGEVSVEVINGKCSVLEVIQLKVSRFKTEEIPNIITPNNDGVNDVLTLRLDDCSEHTFQVFNRWGQLVFETDKPNEEFWNGTNLKNYELPDGTYYYILDSDKNKTGTITLLRSSN